MHKPGLPALEGPKGPRRGALGPLYHFPLWDPPISLLAYYLTFLRLVGLIPMVFSSYSYGLHMAFIGVGSHYYPIIPRSLPLGLIFAPLGAGRGYQPLGQIGPCKTPNNIPVGLTPTYRWVISRMLRPFIMSLSISIFCFYFLLLAFLAIISDSL